MPDLPGFGALCLAGHGAHRGAYGSSSPASWPPSAWARTPSCWAIHSVPSLPPFRGDPSGRRRRLILVNPIAAPALEGPKGVMTKLAVLYYQAAAGFPGGSAWRCSAAR